MLVFLIFLVSAEIFEISPTEISDFVKETDSFKIMYFCDPSLQVCKDFSSSTYSKFLKLGFPVAKIDIVSKSDLEVAQRFQLKDYPYIVYYKAKSNAPLEYKGSLSPVEIFSFMKRVGRGLKNYETWEQIKYDLENELYTEGLILGAEIKNWEEVADHFLPYMPFGSTTSQEIMAGLDCNQCAAVFRPRIFDFTSQDVFTVIKGKNFTSGELFRTYYKDLAFLTPLNHGFLKSKKPLLIYYADIYPKEDTAMAKYVSRKFYETASIFSTEFDLCIGKISDFKYALEDLNLIKHRDLLLIDNIDYLYVEPEIMDSSNKLNAEKIKDFLDSYLENNLQPYIVSEDIPEEPYQNNVKVLVGKNIIDEIANAEKDIVLVVYDRHRENQSAYLVMIFEELAKRVKELTVAKIEASRNLIPQIFVGQFPTAFYIKVGYEPQKIEINYEDPKVIIGQIYSYFRASQEFKENNEEL